MSRIFLTGATGLLGHYVLRDLLIAGHDVVVIVRESRGMDGRERIDEAIRPFETELGRTLPRPMVLEGSLEQAGLGLSKSDRNWLRESCDTVVHSAASIKFHRDQKDNEPYQSNVVGTRNLLELCEDLGLRRFHHVSTAYVCGDRDGTILETDLQCGQSFRNDYEQSKFDAEQLLRDAGFLDSLTIYRPSIIVGDSITGHTSTFHGFYLPLQLAYLGTMAGMLETDGVGYMGALGLRGNERKNLVPVDWVSAVLVRIMESQRGDGQTYHLTSSEPVLCSDIERAISEAIAESAGSRDTAATRIPALPSFQREDFREHMKVYADYFRDDPRFDDRCRRQVAGDLACPVLDRAALIQLAKYAISVNFGWPRPRRRRPELDVQSILSRLPETPADAMNSDAMRLEVSGSCGGVWQIDYVGNEPQLSSGKPNGCCEMTTYLNIYTLRNLIQGVESAGDAIRAGRIIVEGTTAALPRAEERLEVLFRRLHRPQWEVAGAVMDAGSPN